MVVVPEIRHQMIRQNLTLPLILVEFGNKTEKQACFFTKYYRQLLEI